MHALLVLSDEPALAETLASELPEMTVSHQPLASPPPSPNPGPNPSLLVVDDNGKQIGASWSNINVPVVKVSRPVRLKDLLYTIQSQLQSKSAGQSEYALTASIRLLPAERTLRMGESTISLTEKETELLVCLLENNDTSTPRDKLLKQVWGYSDDIATHTLETHIYRLRGKLRQADESLDIVFSDPGGYKLSLSAS